MNDSRFMLLSANDKKKTAQTSLSWMRGELNSIYGANERVVSSHDEDESVVVIAR